MGIYLKLFENDIDYQNYVKSDDYITPNVSYAEDTDIVYYTPQLLDIVYYDGSALKTIHPSQYKSDLGTAVGVIVIPPGIHPRDGKARFIALKKINSYVTWGPTGTDTPLANYTKVPTTNNAGSTAASSNSYGSLPSDDTRFNGPTSYVDPKAKYYLGARPYIPSPYLADDSFNLEYRKPISSGGNVLADFNGKTNTDLLVALGTAYTAANIAKNYAVDGVDIDWYLPAAGELGFLMPRFAAINESIVAAGGDAIQRNTFWSSTENSSNNAYYVNTYNGTVRNTGKNERYYVCPFASL